jgi:putative endopeptidase
MKAIEALASFDDVMAYILTQHTQGFSQLFGLFAEADLTNSAQNIAWVSQSGLGMGERDYYLGDDDRSKELQEAYKTYLSTIFELSGFSKEQAETMQPAVMKFETELAKIMMSRADFRDPYKTFNKLPIEKLQTMMPLIDWAKYFESLGVTGLTELNVVTVDYFTNLPKLLKATSVEDLKGYLLFDCINDASPYLTTDFQNARFDFYSKALSGAKAQKPRWKKMVEVVDGTLGEAVGEEYVKIYFPAEAKERMMKLIDNLKLAFGERFQNSDWMSEETKAKANEKLATFRVKIGYPDTWRDYSKLTIDANDTYYANMLRAIKFNHDFMISEINKPVDPTKWYMNAHQVNAYYNPSTNEICFPAGILQPPFFFMNGDDALNYGAIGMVIAHEMSHGFDDQGRKYDKNGNLIDWWTAEDATRFDERSKVLVDYFNAIEVAPGTFADGKFSLGENIADNGGMQIAFTGFTKTEQYKEGKLIDKLTPAQRFFIAYAGVWAGNIRDAEILRRTKEDEHSLGKWRVNGTLPHIDAFIEAFDIKPGDNMYLAPEKRAKIW